jgi:hypothetical protein
MFPSSREDNKWSTNFSSVPASWISFLQVSSRMDAESMSLWVGTKKGHIKHEHCMKLEEIFDIE